MAGGRIWAAFNHMSPNTPPACQLLHTRWTSKLLLSHRGRHDGASGPGLPPTNSPRTTCSILSLSSRVFERQNSRKPLSAPLHTRALSRNVQLLRGPSPRPPPAPLQRSGWASCPPLPVSYVCGTYFSNPNQEIIKTTVFFPLNYSVFHLCYS